MPFRELAYYTFDEIESLWLGALVQITGADTNQDWL